MSRYGTMAMRLRNFFSPSFQQLEMFRLEMENVDKNYRNKARLEELRSYLTDSADSNLQNYLKELNRNRLYEQVLRYTDAHLREKRFYPRAFLFGSDKMTQNLYIQHLYALQHLPQNQRFQHYIPSKNSRKWYWFVVFFIAYTMFRWWRSRDPNFKTMSDFNKDKGGAKDEVFSSMLSTLLRKKHVEEEKDIKTRFSDVLGIDEFKDELTELVDYLKHPEKYTRVGARLPKGILLVGPPGTGKTLMARALAGEAGCSFYYKSGSEFEEIFVGVGASRIRALFKAARENAPSIIFIDEIDSIAGKRSAIDGRYSRDSINQILSQMDGFKQSDNVIVIGATNMEESLDAAIKRPGRFDKIIHVPLPDLKGRQEIFKYYLQKIKYAKDVDQEMLARRTTGFSGADIQTMVNVAIMNAVKNAHDEASNSDFEYAYDRILMGVGRNKMFVSKEDKLMTAYHEIGHAITSLMTPGASALHKVTILPRGGALGFTAMVPQRDNLTESKKTILAHVDVCMGGRVAEELFYGNNSITTGCSDDLSKATSMVYRFLKAGMQEDVSLISAPSSVKTSNRHNFEIDKQAQHLLDESYKRVKKLLFKYKRSIKQLAQKLAEQETLDVKQIKQLLRI